MKVRGPQFIQAMKQAAENSKLVEGLLRLAKSTGREGTESITENSLRLSISPLSSPHIAERFASGAISDENVRNASEIDDQFEEIAQLICNEGYSEDVTNALFFIAGRLCREVETCPTVKHHVETINRLDREICQLEAAARSSAWQDR